jgi:hypothetical protein
VGKKSQVRELKVLAPMLVAALNESEKELAATKGQLAESTGLVVDTEYVLSKAKKERDVLAEQNIRNSERAKLAEDLLAAAKRDIASLRATQAAHRAQMEAKDDEWEELFNDVADARMALVDEVDRLKESLEWWISEANRRGNVILGMTPDHPEWFRVVAHDTVETEFPPIGRPSCSTQKTLRLGFDDTPLVSPPGFRIQFDGRDVSDIVTSVELSLVDIDPELLALVEGLPDHEPETVTVVLADPTSPE